MVEHFDEQLNLYGVIHALVGSSQSFLQTFRHTLAVVHLIGTTWTHEHASTTKHVQRMKLLKNRLTRSPTHLLSFCFSWFARPKQVRTGGYGSALVRFFQELGGSQSALTAQWSVALFWETFHLLEGSDDQGDCCQLCLAVTDFIFIQAERLENEKRATFVRSCSMSPWRPRSTGSEIIAQSPFWNRTTYLPATWTRTPLSRSFQNRFVPQTMLLADTTARAVLPFPPWSKPPRFGDKIEISFGISSATAHPEGEKRRNEKRKVNLSQLWSWQNSAFFAVFLKTNLSYVPQLELLCIWRPTCTLRTQWVATWNVFACSLHYRSAFALNLVSERKIQALRFCTKISFLSHGVPVCVVQLAEKHGLQHVQNITDSGQSKCRF